MTNYAELIAEAREAVRTVRSEADLSNAASFVYRLCDALAVVVKERDAEREIARAHLAAQDDAEHNAAVYALLAVEERVKWEAAEARMERLEKECEELATKANRSMREHDIQWKRAEVAEARAVEAEKLLAQMDALIDHDHGGGTYLSEAEYTRIFNDSVARHAARTKGEAKP